jgi:protein gp37
MEGRNLPGHHKGPFDKIQFHPERLDAPLRWRKPKRIFVCSMGDLFHEDVPMDWVHEVVMPVIDFNPRHTFMFLTKRPKRMRAFMEDYYGEWQVPLENLWLGVTAENQEMADQRIPILLQTPAAKRFVSVEPCLSVVDLKRYLMGHEDNGVDPEMNRPVGCCLAWTPPLDWVILGGETGSGARYMPGVVPQSIRNQCVSADTPFFFKGWGTYGTKKSDWGYTMIDGREWKEFPA